MNMNKRIALCALLVLVALLVAGCQKKDSYAHLEDDKLTEEALALFSGLEGKHGVMVYQDSSVFSRSEGRLYVVLHGSSGQALSLDTGSKELVLQITGAPMEGYSVWKVVYARQIFGQRTIRFTQNGAEQVMDGVETLDFVVEQANVIEK